MNVDKSCPKCGNRMGIRCKECSECGHDYFEKYNSRVEVVGFIDSWVSEFNDNMKEVYKSKSESRDKMNGLKLWWLRIFKIHATVPLSVLKNFYFKLKHITNKTSFYIF